MNKIPQSQQDLLKQLQDQIDFLTSSAAQFDTGSENESKRLSTAIRIIVNDTSNYKSILTQLNKKNIEFYNSAYNYDPKNLAPHQGLVGMRLSPKHGMSYYAPLNAERFNEKVSFDKWWNEIVFEDTNKNSFSRKDIILHLADTDGGPHVDPTLHEDYVGITRSGALGWKVYTKSREQKPANPIPAAVRQIAHELLNTLKDEFPQLFPRS